MSVGISFNNGGISWNQGGSYSFQTAHPFKLSQIYIPICNNCSTKCISVTGDYNLILLNTRDLTCLWSSSHNKESCLATNNNHP